jgi:phosphatidylinositol glycan class F
MQMGLNNLEDNKIFVHSLITCIYFPIIIFYWYLYDTLVFIEKYKIFLILSMLVFVECIKLFLISYKLNYLSAEKLKFNILTKSKKCFTKIVKEIVKFYLSTIGITIVYYIIIVLYGAPLLTHFEETFILAITLTTLTLTPACLHLGTDNAIILFTGSQQPIKGKFAETIKLNIKVVLLTTWLSAFVLPLDWDQSWQVWPIPCIMGALFGYFIGQFIYFITIIIRKLERKYKKSKTIKIC